MLGTLGRKPAPIFRVENMNRFSTLYFSSDCKFSGDDPPHTAETNIAKQVECDAFAASFIMTLYKRQIKTGRKQFILFDHVRQHR